MRLSDDLLIQPESVAVVKRDPDGKYHVSTTHHPVLEGTTWGMLWGVLFGLLFFIPGFGLAIGAGLGALFGLITKAGIDREFQQRVREMVQPGTSALFMIVDKITPDKALEALSQYGGTVLQTSFSKEAEEELQRALHGTPEEREQAAQEAPAGVA
jgi:uncharacterized membrane protein